MKKKSLMKTFPLAIIAVMVMGCSAQGQGTPIQTQQTTPVTDTAQTQTNTDNTQKQQTPASANTQTQQAQQNAQVSNSVMTEFEKSLNAAQTEVNDLAARISAGNMSNYASLKQEEDSMDHKLDALEDQLEQYYMQNKCDAATYQKLDGQIELMDKTIDNAMDSLELALGIDD